MQSQSKQARTQDLGCATPAPEMGSAEAAVATGKVLKGVSVHGKPGFPRHTHTLPPRTCLPGFPLIIVH